MKISTSALALYGLLLSMPALSQGAEPTTFSKLVCARNYTAGDAGAADRLELRQEAAGKYRLTASRTKGDRGVGSVTRAATLASALVCENDATDKRLVSCLGEAGLSFTTHIAVDNEIHANKRVVVARLSSTEASALGTDSAAALGLEWEASQGVAWQRYLADTTKPRVGAHRIVDVCFVE